MFAIKFSIEKRIKIFWTTGFFFTRDKCNCLYILESFIFIDFFHAISFLYNSRYYDPPMQYCSRNSTPIQFRISSDICIKGSCGKFGRCYQFFSGGNMFSTCTCFAGKSFFIFYRVFYIALY